MPDININSATSVGRGIVDTDRMLGWTSAGVVKADTLAEIIATIKPGRLYTGSDDPTTSPPAGSLEGDVYIRSTGQVYTRGASAYTDSGISLRGTDGNHGNDGQDGNHGTDGKDGAPGSRWFAGSTMPSSGDPAGAIAGDFYLQANGHVFERGSTNWSSTSIDLMGADGARGLRGEFEFNVYISASSAPAKPTGGSYNNISGQLTLPTGGWLHFPETPTSGQEIYQSTCHIRPEATGVVQLTGFWTTPAQITFMSQGKGDKGDAGSDGQDGKDGVGVPTGGTANQVLSKKSNTDYDTQWVNPASGTNLTTDSSITGDGTTANPLKVANPFTTVEHAELDAVVKRVGNIEPQATADQTPTEIRDALAGLTGANRLAASSIQGIPATGLTSVATDSTISGTGTASSPLAVANPFTAADETKLDGIEAGAKDDQSAAEIKTALETLSGTARLAASAIKDIPAPGIDKVLSTDTLLGDGTFGNNLAVANPFSKAEKTKLAGIETGAKGDQTAAEIKTALETLAGAARLDASAVKNITAPAASAADIKRVLENQTGTNRLKATAIDLYTGDSIEGTGSSSLPLKVSYDKIPPADVEARRRDDGYVTPFGLARFISSEEPHIPVKADNQSITGLSHSGDKMLFMSNDNDVYSKDLTSVDPTDYTRIGALSANLNPNLPYKIAQSSSYYWTFDSSPSAHSIGFTRITLAGNKIDTVGGGSLRTLLKTSGVYRTIALAAIDGADISLGVVYSDDNVVKFASIDHSTASIKADLIYDNKWDFPSDIGTIVDADANEVWASVIHVLEGYHIRAFGIGDGVEKTEHEYHLPQTLPTPTGFTIRDPYIWVSTADTIYAVDKETLTYVDHGALPIASTTRYGMVTRSAGVATPNETDAYVPSDHYTTHMTSALNANPPMGDFYHDWEGDSQFDFNLVPLAILGVDQSDNFNGVESTVHCMAIKENTMEAYMIGGATTKYLYRLDLTTGRAYRYDNDLQMYTPTPVAMTFHYNTLYGITSTGRLFSVNLSTGNARFITGVREQQLADNQPTSLVSIRESGTDTFTLLAQGKQYKYPRVVDTAAGSGSDGPFTLTTNTPTGYKTVSQDHLVKLWDCNSRTEAQNVYGWPAMNLFVHSAPSSTTPASEAIELYPIKLAAYNWTSAHKIFSNLTKIVIGKDDAINRQHIVSISVGAGGEVYAVTTGDGGSANLLKMVRKF